MKVWARQFNIYLVLATTLALLVGCDTDRPRGPAGALRIHLEAGADSSDTSQTVSVLRTDPVLVTIAKQPILTEANIVATREIAAPGGFAIEIRLDETGTWVLEQYSAGNPGRHSRHFWSMGRQAGERPLAGGAAHHSSHRQWYPHLYARPVASRSRPNGPGAQQCRPILQKQKEMIFFSVCRAFPLVAGLLLAIPTGLRAQEPFRFPTANHHLFEPGRELEFFAPTAPDKPWTSGSFGCVRNNGARLHEGLDIRHLQTDQRGEPTDPVMATADGTVVYFSLRPSLSNYGNYLVLRHVVEGIEIYSLYAHLSAIRPGLKIGDP